MTMNPEYESPQTPEDAGREALENAAGIFAQTGKDIRETERHLQELRQKHAEAEAICKRAWGFKPKDTQETTSSSIVVPTIEPTPPAEVPEITTDQKPSSAIDGRSQSGGDQDESTRLDDTPPPVEPARKSPRFNASERKVMVINLLGESQEPLLKCSEITDKLDLDPEYQNVLNTLRSLRKTGEVKQDEESQHWSLTPLGRKKFASIQAQKESR